MQNVNEFFIQSWANIVSTVILMMLVYGRSLRHKNRGAHVKWMLSAISLDLVLVALLVCFRKALSKVHSTMHWSLMVHVPLAIFSVLCYFFAIYFGYQLLKGRREFLRPMRIIDRLVMPARILTLLTSILVQVLKDTDPQI